MKHLILLPGLDGTGQLFSPLLEVLPPDWQATVVAYPSDQKLGYAQLRPYVRAVFPRSAPFVLLAESFSGPLAVELAAAAPENLQALILCASFVQNPAPRFLRWMAACNHPVWFRYRLPRNFVRLAAAMWDCDEEVIDRLIDCGRMVQPEVLSFRLAEAFQANAGGFLAGFRRPLLYLRARRDVLVHRRNWREIARLKPDAQVAEIDASHFVLQHKPLESWAAIDAFLTGTLQNQIS